MENFFDTAGVVAMFFCICLLFNLIFKQKEKYGPYYVIKNLSSKQQSRVLSAVTEVERIRKENSHDSTYDMKHFYLLNMEKFDFRFDLSEDEYDAFLNYLGWYYYDSEKNKVRKKKV
ncbi:MAG: hypothetical protein LBP85_01885 [Prevotellaceae bacterium]|jgi:hypothetical protein|nr:hypothetical protein [Prevotellaceae bacterium]